MSETIEIRIARLEERFTTIEAKLDILIKTEDHFLSLLRYGFFPLIVILGALVGIKLAFPTI